MTSSELRNAYQKKFSELSEITKVLVEGYEELGDTDEEKLFDAIVELQGTIEGLAALSGRAIKSLENAEKTITGSCFS